LHHTNAILKLSILAWIIAPWSIQALADESRIIENVANVRPCVVNIEARCPLTQRLGALGNALSLQNGKSGENLKWYTSVASGVIWDSDGHIVTTASVVKDASDFVVKTIKGSVIQAQLVGKDEDTNLAVLKIEPPDPNLNVIPHTTEILPEGSSLILLGYGFGGVPSIAYGVAGMPPEQYNPGQYYFNFTAPVRPGNSGSALIDTRGRLVGIVLGREEEIGYQAVIKLLTQQDQPSEKRLGNQNSYSNFGVAVPVTSAEKIVADIISQGYVVRGWIGVGVKTLIHEGTQQPYLSIAYVVKDSPADEAGLMQGDVILRIDANEPKTPVQLGEIVASKHPDSDATIEYRRSNEDRKVTVKIKQRPPRDKIPVNSIPPASVDVVHLGLTLQDLTPGLRTYFRIAVESGVLVSDCRENSIFDKSGLAAGDVILEVNNQPVSTVTQFNQLFNQSQTNKETTLLVTRDGRSRTVTIPSLGSTRNLNQATP
jgi:serine protease Do